MADVKRIAIKGESGYGPVEGAYREKVTIERAGIHYEYAPFVPSGTNAPLRWSYRTSSAAFGERFEALARLVAGVLGRDAGAMATDVGSIEFAVAFEDGTREERVFWLPASEFQELFAVVRGMLPPLEEAPRVLR